jgi:hypothetical protein
METGFDGSFSFNDCWTLIEPVSVKWLSGASFGPIFDSKALSSTEGSASESLPLTSCCPDITMSKKANHVMTSTNDHATQREKK